MMGEVIFEVTSPTKEEVSPRKSGRSSQRFSAAPHIFFNFPSHESNFVYFCGHFLNSDLKF